MYNKDQGKKVLNDLKKYKFGRIDHYEQDKEPIPFCKQLSLLFYRTKIFAKREPQAVMAKVFN